MSVGHVLVTGATGGVGRRLVAALAAEGVRVEALVRPRSAGGDRAAALCELPGVDLVVASLDEGTVVGRAARRADAVVHLAAQTGTAPRWAHQRVTVSGTRTVLDAAWRAGVGRVVHVSSTSVYGWNAAREPITEDAPLRGRGAYAEAKIAAEVLARRAAARGLPLVVLRPTLVYGAPGETGLHQMADRLVGRGERAGRGEAGRMQPVHVDDVVAALRAAVLVSADVEGAFNVAGQDTVDSDQLGRALQSLERGRPFGPVDLLPPRYSTRRLVRELRVRPRVDLVQGLVQGLAQPVGQLPGPT